MRVIRGDPQQPSSTAAEERAWRRFNLWLMATASMLCAVVYVSIVLIDPHDHLSLSLAADRVPVNQNQRFSYPALARNTEFDSAVIGTSTARLVRPEHLDELLGARFVNLSMNSATAYEQVRLAGLFLRHHPRPRYLIIGLDAPWCALENATERYTFREFPEWLYDSDPFNDYLHLLNGKTLEQAVRMLQVWFGRREPRYGRDGYRNFLPERAEYDLSRAREHLYGAGGPRERTRPAQPVSVPPAEQAAWRIPGVELLRELLAQVPPMTRVLMFFVPYHVFSQPVAGTREHARWQECRLRVAALASMRHDTRVLDFMIESPITVRDENYWDPLHFTTEVAQTVDEALAGALLDRSFTDPAFVWIHR